MDSEETNRQLLKHFETNFNNLEALVSNLMIGYAELACMTETLLEAHLNTLTDEEKKTFTETLETKRMTLMNLINNVSQGNFQKQDDAPITTEPMEPTSQSD